MPGNRPITDHEKNLIGQSLNPIYPQVEGSAKYLSEKKVREDASQVVNTNKFQYSTTTVDGAQSKVNTEMCKDKTATHVVVETTMGCNAFLLFTKSNSSRSEERKVSGTLQAVIKKGAVNVEGKVTMNLNQDEKQMTNGMQFKFYGDLIIKDPPSSIEDAVKISKSIPALCEKSKKPVSFTIVPLKDYCGEAERILNQISSGNVEKVSVILDNFEDMRLYMDRLMESDVATDYMPIEKLLNSLDTQHSAFKHSITKAIQDILPKIRAGGAAEQQLTQLVAKYDESPFSMRKYSNILKTRNREIEVIQSILKVAKDLKNVKVDVDDSGESFSCGLEHQFTLLYELHVLPQEDADTFSKKYADGKLASEEGKWFNNLTLSGSMGEMNRRFSEFAKLNSDSSICFVISLERELPKKTTNFGLVLYGNGKVLEKDFRPPGKVEDVKEEEPGWNNYRLRVTHEEVRGFQAKLEVSAVGPSLMGKPQEKLNFLVPMAQRSTQTVVDFNLFTSASGLKPATVYEVKFKVWMLSGDLKY